MTNLPLQWYVFYHITKKVAPRKFHYGAIISKVSTVTNTKLITEYCYQGLPAKARQVFDEMPERDLVTWTSMISGYVSNAHHSDALALFRDMLAAGVTPNAFTLSSVIKACKGIDLQTTGEMLHAQAVKNGVDRQEYVENSLLDMYAMCGHSVSEACAVFDRLTEKSVVSWTTMIAAYTHYGDGHAGIHLFRQMIQEGVGLNIFVCSIVIRACASIKSRILGKQMHAAIVKSGHDNVLPVRNSIVDMYCRCMSLLEAEQYFNEMPEKDLITWNTMIAGFEQAIPQAALRLLIEMGLNNVTPNCFTYTSIASACANMAVLNCGQQVHGTIIRGGFIGNLQMGNALVDMYAKCGSIADSHKVFNEMSWKDLISWTSLMNGYGIHGYGKEAVELFDEMIISGIEPDSVVFMGVVSACSHAGLVEEGLKYFNLMRTVYNVLADKEVYGCVVDLLGRAGRLTEAYELIQRMPFKPDESIWGALLGACKMHKNAKLGKLAAEKILDLKPKGAKTYVILSDIYGSCKQWDEFAEMKKLIKETGSKKEAGMSRIELRDEVCSFVVGDAINPYTISIYETLRVLSKHMNDSGVVSDFDALHRNFEPVTQ
ncbi:putative tetratricopeptide-like helical domain superfamily [Dioscorea sansibarensis]